MRCGDLTLPDYPPFFLTIFGEGIANDDADFVVGIDIGRKRRKGGGSLNTAASAQVYRASGEFLQYYVLDAQLESETVPRSILQSLFPMDIFAGKRVIVHRDGIFRGAEASIIQNYLAQMGAMAYLVEVIKSGAPRLYSQENKKTGEAPISTALLLNNSPYAGKLDRLKLTEGSKGGL